MSGRRATPLADAARTSFEAVCTFYRWPGAWAALLVSAVMLNFGGGTAMFWFHAIFRGEQGPAIGDVHHWLLDSSLGFLALTPLLALILPLGVRAMAGIQRRRLCTYVGTVAVLFTLTTGPGPFLHNMVAGASTPVARLATEVFGHDPAVAMRNMHVHDRSPVGEGVLQVVVGLPVYALSSWLALHLVRAAIRTSRRTSKPAAATSRARLRTASMKPVVVRARTVEKGGPPV